MTTTELERAQRFAALHVAPETFVIANAWDGGSARLFQGLGFAALATSSSACAGMLGRKDYRVTREEALGHARVIVGATDLPVSADLENGFGASPEVVAETIRFAAEAGLAGGSIEDASGQEPLYDFELAVERVAAAAEAARKLSVPFTLTARTEGFTRKGGTLDETIRRLQAFEKAGADVLFAPGLPDLGAVRAVCSAVSKPVSFMAIIPGKSFSVAELRDAGVKRVSLASSLYYMAMLGALDAAREVIEHGTFGFLDRMASVRDISRNFQG
jgi:2-methylisocitrate lyase-like PEP mutase family enzyme